MAFGFYRKLKKLSYGFQSYKSRDNIRPIALRGGTREKCPEESAQRQPLLFMLTGVSMASRNNSQSYLT